MKTLVLAVLMLFGSTAYADSLTFNGPTANGVNGPYTMSLNGGPATPMICFSDANYIQGGESWNVQAYNINQVGPLMDQFPGSTAQYNELGYLANELFANPGNADLQQALWFVLGAGGTGNSDYTAAVNYVNNNPNYMTSDVFYIPTGPNLPTVNGTTPQPFISQVPEPSTLVLLGGGLLGLIGLSFKKATA